MNNKSVKIGFITTSKQEIVDLLKGWFAISLAFTIMFVGGLKIDRQFFYIFIISAITAGMGFLLHELAHKITAQRYGCFAEFRAFNTMLFLAIVFAFFGVVFAAPGAVFIIGPVGKRRNGIISSAGPITNLVLASVFLALVLYLPNNPVMKYGLMINSWLALFNMIPFMNFDGEKIFRWNKIVYFSMVIIASIFTISQNWIV